MEMDTGKNTLKVKNTVLEAGRPKVAVSIVSEDPKDIIVECEAIKQMPCQIMEWRADCYLSAIEDLEGWMDRKEFYLDLIKILDDINYIAGDMPVIFTIRSEEQGGSLRITRDEAAEIQSLAAQSGLVDFVDIELFDENGEIDEEFLEKQIEEVHGYGCRVILSHHDLESMPEPKVMINMAEFMKRLGADVCKIAAMSSSIEDTELLIKTTAYLHSHNVGQLIMIAMGEAGTQSRVAAGRYGSCITFASGDRQSAPGQADVYTMERWLDEYYG